MNAKSHGIWSPFTLVACPSPYATSSAQWQLQSRKHIKDHRVNESGGSKLDFELKGDVLYEIEAIRLGLNHRLLEASCEKGERLRCNLNPSRTESLEGNAAAYRRREKLRLCTECASEEEGIKRQGREDGAVEDGRNLRCPLQRRKVWEAVWGEAGGIVGFSEGYAFPQDALVDTDWRGGGCREGGIIFELVSCTISMLVYWSIQNVLHTLASCGDPLVAEFGLGSAIA